jgi:hypothetical protein
MNPVVPLDKAIEILHSVKGLSEVNKYAFSDLLLVSEPMARIFARLPSREYAIYINTKIGREVVRIAPSAEVKRE